MEFEQGSPAGGGVVREPAHRSILQKTAKKTDSSGSPGVLLPGSWN